MGKRNALNLAPKVTQLVSQLIPSDSITHKIKKIIITVPSVCSAAVSILTKFTALYTLPQHAISRIIPPTSALNIRISSSLQQTKSFPASNKLSRDGIVDSFSKIQLCAKNRPVSHMSYEVMNKIEIKFIRKKINDVKADRSNLRFLRI